MRYTAQIEAQILDQIEATPDCAVILPDWAYWKSFDQPWVYVDAVPTPLMRRLYVLVVGDLDPGQGLVNPPGVDPRNVNPLLAVVTPTRRSRSTCPNGHPYTDEDYIEDVGHRCQACRAARLLGTPSVADVNRAKTSCPKGHPLVKGNLVKLKNKRRKCLICHREQQAEYRKRKQ